MKTFQIVFLQKCACVYLMNKKVKFASGNDKNVQETNMLRKSLNVRPYLSRYVANEGILFSSYI